LRNLRKLFAVSSSDSDEELVDVSMLEEFDDEGVGVRLCFFARARFAWHGRLVCFFFERQRRGFFFSTPNPDGTSADAGGATDDEREEADVTEWADNGCWMNGGWWTDTAHRERGTAEAD
jgi:hypothetical protein